MFTLLQAPYLEAGGWGKTKKEVEYEGVTWNHIYFDMNGLDFTASIPNSSGTLLANGIVSFNGQVEEQAGYVVTTSFNPGFTPPKSEKKFIEMIQDANPAHIVTAVHAKNFGAKYIVELTPLTQDDNSFWRFLSTDDRLIKMGTDDRQESRRIYFFDSIVIK